MKRNKTAKPFSYLEDMKNKYYVYVHVDGNIMCSVSRYKDDEEFLNAANGRKENTPFIRCENTKDIDSNLRDLKEKHKNEMQQKRFQEEFEKTVGPITLAMFKNKPTDCKCSLETYWRLGRCICKIPFPKL